VDRLYAVADRMNLQYNLVPSLHVTLSIVCVAAFAARASSTAGRAVLWLWGAAIALSTLLTHEHHVLDAVSGWLLAVLGVRCVYRPMTTDRGSESDRQG
jgi:membrane-associated phospholipid phosphatase